jgi:hypothetical protein
MGSISCSKPGNRRNSNPIPSTPSPSDSRTTATWLALRDVAVASGAFPVGLKPGIVIASAALTLGAPFWFDPLKKLLNLRASGVLPGSGTP